jgi:alkylation response protein AidB-like acyl-CoA dehydrogenase
MATTTEKNAMMPAEASAAPLTPKREVGEKEAREVAEAARETKWEQPSFVKELFLGDLRMDLITPFPEPSKEDEAKGRKFIEEALAFLRTVDTKAIDRSGKIPQDVIDGLAKIGAFGMKIPEEYGGRGLSQLQYGRAVALISTACSALGVLLSAHQSIGVPQPLKLFGTPEQKKKYLPRFAAGAISAFALTEEDVGSDPARMGATAEPTEDGTAYILNGEKLWCTNGPIADVLVVMARTPGRNGGRPGITAFIVESSWEGVETTHKCTFMGLNGIENGLLTFRNVRVPKENVILAEGKGLKLALTTLNTGRLTIPMTCAAAGRWCLKVVREWASTRTQWGAAVGKHDAVAQMISDVAGRTFAMTAVAELSSAMADMGGYDIRLEAALAKLYNSEAAWIVGDETMQIRGGRGYETAASLEARGESPVPVEQVLRDLRINRIFEGSSEIMRLFIAREAVDPHLQKAGKFIDTEAPIADRAKDVVGLGMHMTTWFGGNVAGWGRWPRYSDFGRLAGHVRFAERRARKLARSLAYAMGRFGPRLEKKQSVLFRLVDIGSELFAMAAACSYARKLEREGDTGAMELAHIFCLGAERRVDALFDRVFDNDDDTNYKTAQRILDGKFTWLERDIVPPPSAAAQ